MHDRGGRTSPIREAKCDKHMRGCATGGVRRALCGLAAAAPAPMNAGLTACCSWSGQAGLANLLGHMGLWQAVLLAQLACRSSLAAQPWASAREKYFEAQRVDHFGPGRGRQWGQRYFLSTERWASPSGPIFFYAGNESPVEAYLTHTGLIWENAASFGALVVFAEAWRTARAPGCTPHSPPQRQGPVCAAPLLRAQPAPG